MCDNHLQKFFAALQLTAHSFIRSVLLNLIIKDLEKAQERNNEFGLPAFLYKRVCAEMSVCLQLHLSIHIQSLLFARWLSLSNLIVLPIITASHCVLVLTMRARFVDKIAEIEQGGPGSQILNEPLRERESEREEEKQINNILLALITTINSLTRAAKDLRSTLFTQI